MAAAASVPWSDNPAAFRDWQIGRMIELSRGLREPALHVYASKNIAAVATVEEKGSCHGQLDFVSKEGREEECYMEAFSLAAKIQADLQGDVNTKVVMPYILIISLPEDTSFRTDSPCNLDGLESVLTGVDPLGNTLLHSAAAKEDGHLAGVQKLLQLGANVEAKNKEGETPLCVAIERGRGPAAAILVKNSQAKSLTSSFSKEPTSQYAGLLYAQACQLDRICTDDALLPALKAAVEKKEVAHLLRKMKSSCFTPLHSAATSPNNTSDTARFLLQRFPQLVSTRDQEGFLPIHYAVAGALPWGPELVEEMCRMDPRVVNEGALALDGQVPLMSLFARGVLSVNKNKDIALRICRTLLEYGADPNGEDQSGNTPLHYAAVVESWDPSDCVRLLLADGAWESLSKKAPGPGQDGRRLTPERLAAQAGNKRLARLLRVAKKKGEGWATVPAAIGEMLSKEERNARLPELSAQRPTKISDAKAHQETAPEAEAEASSPPELGSQSAQAVPSLSASASGATASSSPLTEAAAVSSQTASESPKAAAPEAAAAAAPSQTASESPTAPPAAAAAAATAATTSDEQEVVDDDFIRRVAREAIMKKIQELYGTD